VTEAERHITELNAIIESKRTNLAGLDKEIHEGGATLARYQNNIQLRKSRATLAKINDDISKLDLEEAARAKRNFDKLYPLMKAKLDKLIAQVCSSKISPYLVHFDRGMLRSVLALKEK
jgi:DNA repair protein RAD50